VFSNLNWWNLAVLLLLALFIFGDKLPQMISDGLRMLRNLRRMAQNATTDLSRELGTDIALEDLNPKVFVRKHLLSEEDQETLTRPIKQVSDDMNRHVRGVGDEVRDAGRRLTADSDRRAGQGAGAVAGLGAAARGDGAGAAEGGDPGAATDPGDATDPGAPPPRGAGYDDIT
jgi:sec-independent protein translocase protein TatB